MGKLDNLWQNEDDAEEEEFKRLEKSLPESAAELTTNKKILYIFAKYSKTGFDDEMLKLFENRVKSSRNYDPNYGCSVKRYYIGVAYGCCREVLRKRGCHPKIEPMPPDVPDHRGNCDVELCDAKDVFSVPPPKGPTFIEAEFLRLKFLERKSDAEVEKELRLTKTKLKELLKNIKKKLAKLLGEKYRDEDECDEDESVALNS